MLTIAAAVLALAAPAQPPDVCRTRECGRRVHMRRVVRPYRHWLHRTATCESSLGTGRPKWHINTGNGFYGGLQFTRKSWAAMGGRGLPHEAPALEQKYRGVKLLHAQGRGAWPVCG